MEPDTLTPDDDATRVLFLDEMTAPQVDALDRQRTCVLISISPIEEHGPHLPLATDVIEAEGMVTRLCQRLTRDLRGWTLLIHPSVPLGVDAFPYPGSVSVRPSVIRDLVEDLGASLAREGFTNLLVASHHGSPRHNLAIDAGARRAARHGARVLALAGRIIAELYIGQGLDDFMRREGMDAATREMLEADCHAGAWETSEMLLFRPELVQESFRQLPPVIVSPLALTPSAARQRGDGQGYFGAPAMASRELGERYVEAVLDAIYDDVLRFLGGEDIVGLPRRWRAALAAAGGLAQARDLLGQ